MTRWFRMVVGVPLGVLAAGGCGRAEPLAADDAPWAVTAYVEGPSSIAVGDTVTLQAFAWECTWGCPVVGFPAAPERFRWESLSPGLAEVAERGLFRARAVGEARVRATFLGANGGGTSDLAITVVPQAASIALRPDRDTVRVGDTVRVAAVALDDAGRVVPGTVVRYDNWAPGVLAAVPGSIVGQPGGGSVLFQAIAPGTSRVEFYRDYVRETGRLRTTAGLTVVAGGG